MLAGCSRPAQAKLERRVSLLFDRIEKACPRLFRGETTVTEPLVNSRAVRHFDLGMLSAWEHGDTPLPAACRERRSDREGQ
jgi:hypothetical protein